MYSIIRTKLTLLRRLNYRRVPLTDNAAGESVGVLRPNGEVMPVRWMGFIERSEARCAPDAKPVRLADIADVGREEGPSCASGASSLTSSSTDALRRKGRGRPMTQT